MRIAVHVQYRGIRRAALVDGGGAWLLLLLLFCSRLVAGCAASCCLKQRSIDWKRIKADREEAQGGARKESAKGARKYEEEGWNERGIKKFCIMRVSSLTGKQHQPR